jgi:hypothetical protein
MIEWLNNKADDIASDVEREVRRVLRPFVLGAVSVQAEVRFRPGTLIIEGAVIAVVGALGTVTGQAVSQALGQNLARLLEVPINRLLRRWLNRGNEAAVQGQFQFEPFGVDITPGYSTQIQQQATVPPGSEERTAPGTSGPGNVLLSWTAVALAALNTVLLIVLLLLLLMMETSTGAPGAQSSSVVTLTLLSA